MFKINELRILPEHHLLIVDVEIKRLPYYENVFLNEIKIDTQDTFNENGPSDNPVFQYFVDGDKKSVRLEIDLTNEEVIKWSDENCMFFVYITSKGLPSEYTPHGLDVPIILEVVADYTRIYNKGMQYLRELNVKEILPKGFIDFIFLYKALIISVKSRHYLTAIEYWKKFTSELERPNYSKLPIGYGRISI